MCGCNTQVCGCNDITIPSGAQGYNGWLPILADIVDAVNLDDNGKSRIVQQIIGWTAGSGPTPSSFLNYYLSSTGPVSNIALATNIKGPEGVGYVLSSNTSITPTLGSQLAVVDVNALDSAYVVGSRVRFASNATPTTKYFEGVITAYSGTNLTLDIDYFVGGNASDWNISIAGELPSAFGFNDMSW